MVFTTEVFFEVAIESWPEWNLNPRPLNSVQTFQPTELSGHELNSDSETKRNFENNATYISAPYESSRRLV